MREYEVTLGNGSTTTMQLDEQDAKRLNAEPVKDKAAQPANKARTPSSK